MTKDEALQMCLEYIETDAHERRHVRWAIKEALAQEQERKPLTDKRITKVISQMPNGINGWMSDWDLYEYTRAVEAAHGIKENT